MKMTLNKRDFKDDEYWEGILDSLGVPEDHISAIYEIDVNIELFTVEYNQLTEIRRIKHLDDGILIDRP